MIEATAPGKVVLTGEYAVLDGAPALVAAVDRRARVLIRPASGLTVNAPQLGIAGAVLRRTETGIGAALAEHEEPLRVVTAIATAVARAVKRPFDNLQLDIDTAPFFEGGLKVGLGSSAAVAVALGGALAEALGWRAKPKRLLAEMLAAHRAAQGGRGSGLDVAASMVGGICVYARERVLDLVMLPPPVECRVIFTGESASTSALVAKITQAPAARPVLDRMAQVAERARAAVVAADAAAFLAAVEDAYQTYDTLGTAAGVALLTEAHRRLHARAVDAGAAYKPSGAGGGDIGLWFTAGPPSEELARRVAEDGGALLPLRLGDKGLQVHRH